MIRDAAGPVPAHPANTALPPRPAAPPEPASGGPVKPPVPMLNPRMRIDTELNLVVLEFRDDAGEVRNSIPTPREMDAYRLAAQDAGPLPEPGLDVTR